MSGHRGTASAHRRRRLIAWATLIVLFALSAHPELFSLGTLVDALGVDGLLVLLELQLGGLLLAWLPSAWARCRPPLASMARQIGDAMVDHGGPVGQYAWLCVATHSGCRLSRRV